MVAAGVLRVYFTVGLLGTYARRVAPEASLSWLGVNDDAGPSGPAVDATIARIWECGRGCRWAW
jgi:hypothetical protein